MELHCEDFLNSLSERAIALSNRVLEHLNTIFRADCNRIAASFEEISRKTLTAPNNVEEMVALQKFIDETRSVTMRSLEEAVDEAKKR